MKNLFLYLKVLQDSEDARNKTYFTQFDPVWPWQPQLHCGHGTMVSLQNADKDTQQVGAGNASNWEYEQVTLYVAKMKPNDRQHKDRALVNLHFQVKTTTISKYIKQKHMVWIQSYCP